MSFQTLACASTGGAFHEWVGSTPFNSGLRASFPAANPTFPSGSAITSVLFALNVSNLSDADANSGLVGGGVNIGASVSGLAAVTIHVVDNGGYVNQVISRPGGGAYSFADITNLEVFCQASGGSSSTMSFNNASITPIFTIPAPSAATAAPTNVTPSSATLNGIINPNGGTVGFATTYYFQYGFTTAYGTNTTLIPNQIGSSSIIVLANLAGLVANSTYHYRVVAQNADNVVVGSDQTFLTSGGDVVVLHL